MERERPNTAEDARSSGEDQTEGDGEESIEHLQPDGTVAVDDILASQQMRNEHKHYSGIGLFTKYGIYRAKIRFRRDRIKRVVF